jgi:hypothetical protein
VVVDGQFAYIGHMDPGVSTSIADVNDPLNPRIVAQVPVAADFHSHKVRASNGLMLVNRELVDKAAVQAGVRGGLGIYDISNHDQPQADGSDRRPQHAARHGMRAAASSRGLLP